MSENHRYSSQNVAEFTVDNNDSTVRADLNILEDKSDQIPCSSCKKDPCEHIEGNVVEVDVKKDDCEIRSDIQVDRRNTVRLWGQVKDCNNYPVKCALVKLVKIVYKNNVPCFEGVAHTVTDCMGFYQFDICSPYKEEKFKVIVSKPAIGRERKVNNEKCNPCKHDCSCI